MSNHEWIDTNLFLAISFLSLWHEIICTTDITSSEKVTSGMPPRSILGHLFLIHNIDLPLSGTYQVSRIRWWFHYRTKRSCIQDERFKIENTRNFKTGKCYKVNFRENQAPTLNRTSFKLFSFRKIQVSSQKIQSWERNLYCGPV